MTLEALIVKAKEETQELFRRLKQIADISLNEEESSYRIELLHGLMGGIHRFLKDAKDV